jgi:toxin ParE1/3/4
MSRYVLSPKAQDDLRDIWDYTAERWGAEQANEYLRILQRAIEVVADEPRRGRSCDEVRKGYRKYSAGSHMLIYRKIETGIDIVRVLHGRMDFERHL